MNRILTALVLIPIILYVVLWGPGWLVFAVTGLVAVICYSEYCGIAAAYGFGNPGPVGYGAGLLVLVLPGDEGLALTLVMALALALSLCSENLAKMLPRAAVLLLGIIYIFGGWKCAIRLHSLSPHWLLFGLVLNWVGDIAAYYVGKNLGRHKLAPRISPGKSWEGAVASLAASVVFGVIYIGRFVPAAPLPLVAGLAAAANVAGQIGDLCESAMKRGAGLKDSGAILPGHGGLLDRVDSTLFALPVVYLFLRRA